MRSSLVTVLLFALVSTNAQSVLVPGKNSFEKQWIRNTNYRMTWYFLKDPSKLEVGKITTQVIIDNRELKVVTQVSMKRTNAPWIDSTVADISTLRPIRHASYNQQRDMVLNFGKIVTGFYNDKVKNSTTIINDTAAGDYFDSNLYPALIAWLPLKEGYRQDIAIYDYNPAAKIGVIKAFVKEVQSGEYKTTKSGQRKVWVITVSDEIGNNANNSSTYFIDKADRRLWKQAINAGERKMEMLLEEE